MNKKIIIYTLGWVLILEALCMLLPFACALIYHESAASVFLLSSAICLVVGSLLKSINPENRRMYPKEGLVVVSLSWIVICLFGTLPFFISGEIPNFFDALFETVSGFTTTGASVLRDVENLSRSMLFWRSFTHWIGGMGVLVFLLSILRISDANNIHLLKAESTGANVSKFVPHIKTTAKILYTTYTLLTVLEIVLLIFGGMDVFEAITLSFGTAGTGGFGVRNTSVADYTSYQQSVITVFMMIFGVDFSLYYLLFIKKFKDVLRSEELRAYIIVILSAIILISVNISGYFTNIWDTIRHSAFQVVSIVTTTGYSTVDFNGWPEFSKIILVLLMFIGGCAGSTSGGIKVSRILIAFKTIIKELKTAVHPKSTHKISLSGKVVAHETIRSVNIFVMAYFSIFAISLLLISIDNFDFTTNFTALAATINDVGPGFSAVGPTSNYSGYSDFSKIILCLNMLVGRLEVFPMLILFSPYTWKK